MIESINNGRDVIMEEQKAMEEVEISIREAREDSIQDDQLVIIKEEDRIPEIKSDTDAISNLETERNDSVNGGDSQPKTVKINERKTVHQSITGSEALIMEREQEVKVDGEDQFVSVLFSFQRQSEVQRFTESVSRPSPTASCPSYDEGLQQSDLGSLQSSRIESTISESKADCPFFNDVVAFSESFVDNIIQHAKIKVNSAEKLETDESVDEICRYDSQDSRFKFHIHERTFTGWPSIGEFNSGLGAEKINDYLSSFKTKEDWTYAVYYKGTTIDCWSSLFHYEVIWSLPTPRYPIVQAAATMYFDIEMSLMVPSHCKVKVSYWYEGNNFHFDPEITEFNEFTLNHILDKKLRWFKSVTY